MRFWGTGIKLYATKSPSGGPASVYVDGQLVGTLNLTAPATTYKSLVFSKTLGTAGASHLITVALTGTASGANSSVGLDYLLVT